MDIKKIIKEHHQAMIDKGFYDCPDCEDGHPGQIFRYGEYMDCPNCDGLNINPNKNIGELLMLIITELSEALEAHRNNRFANWHFIDNHDAIFNTDSVISKKHSLQVSFEKHIKDTFEDEIADVFLRLFDLCGYLDVVPEIKFTSRNPDKNIAEELLNFVSFCTVIHGIFKMPPINPCEVARIKIGWLLADMLKFCKTNSIPIKKHIYAKMAYNKSRPHKHGKEY